MVDMCLVFSIHFLHVAVSRKPCSPCALTDRVLAATLHVAAVVFET